MEEDITSCVTNGAPSSFLSSERRRASPVSAVGVVAFAATCTLSCIRSSPPSAGRCVLLLPSSNEVDEERPSAALAEESLARTLPTLPVGCIGATAHLGCGCCLEARIPCVEEAPPSCSEPKPPLSVTTLKTSTNPTNPTNVIDRKRALIRCLFAGRYVAAGERRRAKSSASGSSGMRPASISWGGSPSAACRGAIVALGLGASATCLFDMISSKGSGAVTKEDALIRHLGLNVSSGYVLERRGSAGSQGQGRRQERRILAKKIRLKFREHVNMAHLCTGHSWLLQ